MMNEPNGQGRDIVIQAPPAVAQGLARPPGSAVPTPARLSMPMAKFEVQVPFDRIVALIRLLKEFYGDEFPVAPNLSLEIMSRLSAADVAELQEMFRKDVPDAG